MSGPVLGGPVLASTKIAYYDRKARAARLRQDPSLTKHGRPSTYVNWDCRCTKCAAAWATYDAALRRRHVHTR